MKMADIDLAIKEGISTFLTTNNFENNDDIVDSLSEEFVSSPHLALHIKSAITLQLKKFLITKYLQKRLYGKETVKLKWDNEWVKF